MALTRTIIKTQLLGFGLLLIVAAIYPRIAHAQTVDEPAVDTTTTTTETGPDKPTGEVPYTYNEATGMWENDKYIWNPATGQTTPKGEVNYSYNPATGQWDTKDWVYNPVTKKYEPNTGQSQATPTTDENLSGEPNSLLSTSDSGGSPLSKLSNPDSKDGSNLDIDASSDTSGIFDMFYNATISNQHNSTAVSGDATVEGNTTAGSATTGNANAIANFINSIASYWSGLGGNLMTFVSDIYNNVFGDLIIDPSQLAAAMNQKINSESNKDVEINVAQDNAINNDINLNAQSGNALVDSNTNAGDATTGSANTVANVLNMINSAITSGTSFLGTINIHGSLEGDILFPPGVLESVLASNAPGGTFDADLISNTDVLADINSNSAINNNTHLNAQTGSATVDSNTNAGDATTGDASTQLTILNLTNHQVIGSNALLVFVNVLGDWIGLIMDAPVGTTAAAIGGGVADHTQLSAEANAALDIEIDTSNVINNNLNLNSASGDASVTNNTNAGDATTGDATASANIANLINTGFNLDDWFGVLFVNVFGDWFGSLGVDTIAGTPQPTPDPKAAAAVKDAKVFRFKPSAKNDSYELVPINTNLTYSGGNSQNSEATKNQKPSVNQAQQVLADITEPVIEQLAQASKSPSFLWPIFGGLTATALLGTERWLTWREDKKPA